MTGQPLNFHPSQVVLDTRTPGPTPPPPQEDPTQKRLADTQRELGNVRQENKQLATMVQQVSGKLDELATRPAPSATPAPQEPQKPSQPFTGTWEEYLEKNSGGTPTMAGQSNGGNVQPPPGFVSREEAQRIADERIAATLQGINQNQNTANALVSDFRANHQDLAPYEGLVSTLVQNADQRLPVEQRYSNAINQTRGMLQAGALPRPQAAAPPANPWQMQPPQVPIAPNVLQPQYPSGGQVNGNNNPWATPAPQTTVYNDAFVAQEAQDWADARKAKQKHNVW